MSPGRATRGVGAARRRENRARRTALIAGTLAVLVALALMYVAFKSPTGIPLKPYYNVNAQFTSLGTLEETGNVTIRGKLVGQVVDLRLVHGVPTVDLQMNPGTKIPVGSTARIRPRGLLGEEYVDITPSSSSQTIKSGGTIPASDTSEAVQLTGVFAGMTAPARANTQKMINGLGEGLLGRGAQLNQALATAPGTLANLTHGLTPLINSDTLPGLISGANALTSELDAVTYDFYPGMHYGAESLQPFATEAASVAKLLEESPSDMASIQTSLASTDTTLTHLSRFAAQATRFTALAPNALVSLTRVLTRGRAPLGSARTLLEKLAPAIKPTLAATAALNPELPDLSRFFNTTTPVLNTLTPYDCYFDGFAHNWRSFLGVGSVGQSGPLGPYTTLRLGISSPGTELASTAPLPTTYDATPKSYCPSTTT